MKPNKISAEKMARLDEAIKRINYTRAELQQQFGVSQVTVARRELVVLTEEQREQRRAFARKRMGERLSEAAKAHYKSIGKVVTKRATKSGKNCKVKFRPNDRLTQRISRLLFEHPEIKNEGAEHLLDYFKQDDPKRVKEEFERLKDMPPAFLQQLSEVK